MHHIVVTTPLGPLTVVAAPEGLTDVSFDLPGDSPHVGPPGTSDLLRDAQVQLEEYFAGRRRTFDLPLQPAGDAFARRVWELLLTIPYGTTTTYGALAAQLGDANLAQAVGQASGRNPIAVVIPCHRVIGADGSLTGYAGGLDRKRALLALEEPGAQEAGRLF